MGKNWHWMPEVNLVGDKRQGQKCSVDEVAARARLESVCEQIWKVTVNDSPAVNEDFRASLVARVLAEQEEHLRSLLLWL